MNTPTRIALVSLLICAILTACGPSKANLDGTATQDMVNLSGTQTAQVPTSTATPQPTATATSTPTATLVPTATPKLTATMVAATQEARLATQQAGGTATAVSALATQQAEDLLWAQLEQDGSITYSKGSLYEIDDFEESWAQRSWYRWWWSGYRFSDFVVMTHIDWEIPEDAAFGTGGCGFAFRIKDENNHLIIFLTPKGSASLGAMTINGFQYQSFHWQNPDNPNFATIPQTTVGSADLIVVVEKEFVTAYINGEKIYQWYVALTDQGDVGYTIVSGTNKDFGISCKFTNTRIWGLEQ